MCQFTRWEQGELKVWGEQKISRRRECEREVTEGIGFSQFWFWDTLVNRLYLRGDYNFSNNSNISFSHFGCLYAIRSTAWHFDIMILNWLKKEDDVRVQGINCRNGKRNSIPIEARWKYTSGEQAEVIVSRCAGGTKWNGNLKINKHSFDFFVVSLVSFVFPSHMKIRLKTWTSWNVHF